MPAAARVGAADLLWHTTAAPVRVAVRSRPAVTPGRGRRWTGVTTTMLPRPAWLLRWTAADEAQLAAHELVSRHVAHRYLLVEAGTIVATGAARDARRLVNAARSLRHAVASRDDAAMTDAVRDQLVWLADAVARVEDAALPLVDGADTAALRAQLLVAVDGYVAAVQDLARRTADTVARVRGAA